MTMPVSLPDVSFKKYPFCWADMSRNDLSSTVPGHVATYVEASPFYPVLPLYFPGVSLRSDCASSQDIVNSEVIKLPDLSLLLITTIMAVAIKALVVASHAIDDASVLLPILPPIDRIESSDDVRSVATESPLGDLLDGDVRDELEGGLPNDIGVISNESPRILPVVTEPSFSTTSLDDVEEHYCKGELALPMFHYTEEVFAAASGVSPKSQGVLDREVEEAVNLEASKQHMVSKLALSSVDSANSLFNIKHDNDATLSPTPLRTSRLRRSPVLSQRGLEYTADQAIKFERLARLRAKRAARSEPPKTSEPFSPPRTRSKTVPPTQAIPRERRATAKPLKSRK
ncbi:hypothetical protein H0H92_007641 [Tricholoma furcatifolium]|nr:hypothetical protein H0H92_007641 [Tricholoma furcatifolium]